MNDGNQSTGRESREDLEIQKLKADIEQITAPFWKKTTFWLAAITLGIAVPGTFVQWATSTVRYERAQLEAERRIGDVRNELEKVKRDISRQRLEAERELEAIRLKARKASRPIQEMVEKLGGGAAAQVHFELSENDFYILGVCHDESGKPITAKVELLDAAEKVLAIVTSNPNFGGLFAIRIPEKARDRDQYQVRLRLSAEGKNTKHHSLFYTGPYLYRADFRPED